MKNEVGEVWIKSITNFSKYWNNEEATNEAFYNDWFRSGD